MSWYRLILQIIAYKIQSEFKNFLIGAVCALFFLIQILDKLYVFNLFMVLLEDIVVVLRNLVVVILCNARACLFTTVTIFIAPHQNFEQKPYQSQSEFLRNVDKEF